jgi:hypothetical protein
MNMKDAVSLMVRDTEVKLTEKQVMYCYGMSKMTVKNEMEKGAQSYQKLIFVEFLEFIGRIAYEKYKNLSEPLFNKIDKIIGLILPLVGA